MQQPAAPSPGVQAVQAVQPVQAVHGVQALPQIVQSVQGVTGVPGSSNINIPSTAPTPMIPEYHAVPVTLPPNPIPMPDQDLNKSTPKKRELSQSKRAAQNRAAQRAFRQRKEGYIKSLEQQVRSFNEMENHYKAIEADNTTLRQYVIRLQSRLLEAQGSFPQPPAELNLDTHPSASQPPHDAGHTLEAVAQAVTDLSEHQNENLHVQQQEVKPEMPDELQSVQMENPQNVQMESAPM